MENTSLENRKKRYEEKQRESYVEKNGGNESFNKALEERINRYNSKTKWENQIDTNVWMTGNPLEEFARDYAARQVNEAARKERQERIAQKNAVRNEMIDYRRLGEIQLKAQKRTSVQSVAGNMKAAELWNQDSRKPSAYQELQKEGTWQQENRRLAEAKQKAWDEKRKAEQQAKIEQNRKNMTGIIEKGPFKEGLERVVPYDELRNRPDFRAQVEQGRNKEANPVAEVAGGSLLGYLEDRVKNPYFAMKRRSHNLEELYQEERNMYHYLYSRYGAEQADQYATSLDAQMNERKGRKMYESAAELRENHPVAGIAANIGRSAGAGVLSLGEGISRIPAMVSGNPVAEVPSAMDYYMGMLQENTESFPERSAYEAANSIGFMLPGALLGGALGSAAAGSSLFAAGVTGNAYNEAVMEGKDIDRARAYALASGASEEATQLLLGGVAGLSSGIGKRLFANSKIAAAAAKGLDGLIKNDKARKLVAGAGSLGADMVSEGTQEYTQELLDKAMRNMLFDEKNQIRLDDPEAWHAAFLGAVTAGAMNAPGMVVNTVSEMRGKKPILPEIQEETTNPDNIQEEAETPHIADFNIQAEDSRGEQEKTEYGQETEPETEVMQQEVRKPETADTVQEDADILEETAVQFGPNGKTAYVDQYDNDTWLPSYTRAFQRAYSAGRYNVDMDIAQRTAALAVIGNDQFMAAWKAGVQDRQLELNRQKPFVQGQARTGSMTDFSSESTSAQRTVAEHVGKMTGLQIELVDGLEAGAKASYGEGKIRISVNSDDFLGSTSHELTHFIKEYAPEQYRDYEDTAVKALMKAENTTFETLYEQYVNRYADAGQNLTHDEIVEEIVSDATQKFFNDEEFIREVAAKNETVGQKILAFINDVIDAIQELIYKGKRRKAAAGLEENLVMFKRARRNWMQALEEAGTVYKEGGIKSTSEEQQFQLNQFGLEEYTEKEKENWKNSSIMVCNSRQDIVDFCKNNLHKTPYKKLYIGKVGNELAERLYKDTGIKLDNYNIVLTSWFENSHADAEKEEKRGQITVTPEMIADLPEIISSYDRVLDAGKTQQGKPVLKFEKDINGKRVAIEYVSDKKKSLTVQTMYAWSNKNRNLPTAPDALASAQTPETLSGTVPTDLNIKDKNQSVNGDNKRFQLKEPVEDSEGRKLTKAQQEYFKDSVVRDDEGRLLVMYHGTPNSGFTEFRPGTYFTDKKWYADVYHEAGASMLSIKRTADNPGTYEVYLDIKKPFDTRLPEVREIWDEDYYRQWGTGTPLMESGLPDWTDGMDIQEFIEENELDFDGIILDEGGFPGEDGEVVKRGLSYIIMSPKQVKNVDNTTPTDSKDIRFQLEEVEDYTDVRDINTLLKENEKLREANELLKKQFELTSKEEMRQSDIHKVSVNMLKKYGSRMKAEKLERNITRLYEYIRSGEQVAWNEVAAVAADIGREILRQSTQVDTTMSEQYADLRKQIQNTKIMISDQDKQDLMAAGGYNSFRKKYFGTLKLGKDGISVDSLYQELSDQHPELFDSEITHPAGQLEQIGAVMDLTKPQIKNPYHADMDEMAYLVGQELLQEYYNVRQPVPTFADRREADLEKVKKQYKEKLAKYKESTEKQYAKLLKDARRETRNVREEKETELLAQKIKYDRRMKERNENLRKREAKARIIKEVNAMSKWLLNPTDKNHVPEELRGIVAEFLGSIDFSSKQDYNGIQTQRTQKWLEMKAAVDRIRDSGGTMQDEDGNIVYVDIDPDMAARIEEIRKKITKVEKLEELDAYAMEEVMKLVQSMKTALRGINDLKRNQAYGKASMLAEEVFRETENMKNNRELKGAAGAGVKLMNVDMLDPQTMFGKMGAAMKSTYDGLRDGEDKQTQRIREAEIYFKDALRETEITEKDIRKWSGDGAETTVFELSNGTIELSIPQVMSLYLMEKRGQARKHIYSKSGGIKAAARSTRMSIKDGKLKLAEIKRQHEPIKVSKEDIKRITDSLTEDQKKLANAIQYFMGNVISEWGNETSMEMYGYKKFTAKDYFPIKTDQNYNSKPEGRQENSAIKNLGMTKNTNQYANNPVIVEDVFDVFTRQVEQMSCYNAYVAPLSDLHKVMNYKDMRGYNGSSIKERLSAVFGDAGVKYIDKLVEDINGSVKADASASIMSKLLSNTKAASVAGNLRVAVQQPTAIARAYAEMDAKYIAGGLMKPGADWNLIVKYAPIAQWKDWGFYQMQVSRQLKDVLMGTDSAKQRFVNKTMILAQLGDEIAWKRLWNAVELEVKDKKPNLKEGSEEFYQAVGKRFSEIVDRTQVVDSVLHRPQIMRSKDGAVKQAVSFMAEPMKTYNMLYRAVWTVKASEKGSDARKQAYKKMEQAGAAYVASGFLTAVAASFIDALRDDDREKTHREKYKENFKENLLSNLILLNNIPYVKDVLSVFQGYTAKRMETQGIQDIYFAHKKVQAAMEGKGKYTPQFVFLEAIRSVSALTGIPIKSITRDALAIIDTVSNGIGGEADYKWLKNTYDISHKENLGYYVKMMMQAEQEGDGKLSELIKKDLLKAGFSEDDVTGRVNSYLNDYMDEELGIDLPAAAMAVNPDVKGSKEEFQRQVEVYVETKARVGWDEKKSLSTIKSQLTNYFKPMWQQAKTREEKDAIIAQCNRLYYHGKNIYSGKDYEGWKK